MCVPNAMCDAQSMNGMGWRGPHEKINKIEQKIY